MVLALIKDSTQVPTELTFETRIKTRDAGERVHDGAYPLPFYNGATGQTVPF